MSPEEGGDRIEKLMPVAARIACVIHGDGDHHDITHHTKNLGRDDLLRLIVILGAMVDPGTPVDDALGFITWDEHGRPKPPIVTGPRLRIRSLAADVEPPADLGAERVLKSERVQLAREIHLGQGYTVTETARQLGIDPDTVRKWLRRVAA
ncbi:helix-turn-helix domain-containing protein [Kitasatospora sp. NPDC005856]|uniref:helix-turn-helix domain-containing protein n=1 Tax=Kitasatospora sp. NPDC005856 TaxID=3154566 RepID=UPI0033C6D105